jgi:hypothetical protein
MSIVLLILEPILLTLRVGARQPSPPFLPPTRSYEVQPTLLGQAAHHSIAVFITPCLANFGELRYGEVRSVPSPRPDQSLM